MLVRLLARVVPVGGCATYGWWYSASARRQSAIESVSLRLRLGMQLGKRCGRMRRNEDLRLKEGPDGDTEAARGERVDVRDVEQEGRKREDRNSNDG